MNDKLCMEGTRPLIFILPLSETLTTLKDVISETSAEDGIEIYELDNLSEALQLIPTIGQAVILASNAKKCALLLQGNRKALKSYDSKVILLSSKVIPKKIMDKFIKMGLSDSIVEPIQPKTLLYKVNLLLRSIVVRSAEKVEDDLTTFSMVDEAEDQAGEQDALRIEKGIIVETTDQEEQREKKESIQIKFDEDENETGEKKKTELIFDEEEKSKKKGSELLIDSEEVDKKSTYEEDEISKFYKGEQKKSSLLDENILDDEDNEEPSVRPEDFGDEISKLKKELEHELLKEDTKNKSRENPDSDIDSYMRGDLNKTSVEIGIEEEKSSKKNEDLGPQEELDSLRSKTSSDEELDLEEESKKKMRNEVDLEIQKEKKDDLQDDSEEVDNKKKTRLDLEVAPEDKRTREELEDDFNEENRKKSRQIENELQKEKEKKANHGKVDQIEKYYKSDVKKNKDSEGGIKAEERDRANQIEDEQAADKNKKREQNIDIENKNENEEKSPYAPPSLDIRKESNKEAINDEEADQSNKDLTKDGPILEVEGDEKNNSKEDKDLNPEDESDLLRTQGNDTQLALEKDSNKKNEKLKEEEEFDQKKASKGLNIESPEKSLRAKSQTDKIETHYNSKKSISHADQDWNFERKKAVKEDIDTSYSKRGKDEILKRDKKDLGEQTIDYAVLKKQFADISMESSDLNKKKRGGGLDEGEALRSGLKTAPKDLPSPDIENDSEETEDEAEDKEKKVIEPNPVGLDVAIQVLNLYMNKEIDDIEIYKTISKHIWDRYKGHVSFYVFDRKKETFEHQLQDGHDEYSWEELEKEHFEEWTATMLPTWTDITYQAKEIQFTYPYFEGMSNIGLAVISFMDGIEQKYSKEIEIILETARGLYLENFHKEGNVGSYKRKAKEIDKPTSEKEKKKGLFGGLFKS